MTPLPMSQGVTTTNELFPHDTWRTHIQTSSCLTSLGGCDSVSCLPTGRNRRRPVMLLTNSGRPAGDSIGSQCHYLCRGIRGACMPLLCPLYPNFLIKKRQGFSVKVACAIFPCSERARGPQNVDFESKNVGFYSKRRLRAIFRQRRRTLKNLCKRL